MQVHARTRGAQAHRRALRRAGDQPARRRVGGGRHLPGPRGVQEARRARPARPHQARGLRRRGLDYSYSVVMAEALGSCRCGGVPMAIGVQTDMATPALARFGSDELRAEFLAPAIAGTAVACVGVSEPGAGSDVAAIRTTARARRRRLRDRRRQAVDHQRQPGRLDVPVSRTPRRTRRTEQVADHRADEDPRRHRRAQAPQDRHALLGHGADPLRRRARPAAQPHRRGRHGLHLPDAAVPGGAPVGAARTR